MPSPPSCVVFAHSFFHAPSPPPPLPSQRHGIVGRGQEHGREERCGGNRRRETAQESTDQTEQEGEWESLRYQSPAPPPPRASVPFAPRAPPSRLLSIACRTQPKLAIRDVSVAFRLGFRKHDPSLAAFGRFICFRCMSRQHKKTALSSRFAVRGLQTFTFTAVASTSTYHGKYVHLGILSSTQQAFALQLPPSPPTTHPTLSL